MLKRPHDFTLKKIIVFENILVAVATCENDDDVTAVNSALFSFE
jgi:hypothetical protein